LILKLINILNNNKKTMVNYKNSKVYELICSQTGKKYIGSTTQKLCQRLAQHKTMTNNCSSKILINPKIYLLTYVPCDSKEELHAIERLYIENNECINKVIPNRTQKEYYESHKEQLIEYSKKWAQDNPEKVKTNKKKYYEDNQEQIKERRLQSIICECGARITKHHIVRHRRSNFHQEYENLWN